MKLILNQLMDDSSENLNKEVCEDDVSHLYYGDHCNCGKTAKCQSTKCICFLRGVKCQSSCHGSSPTKCINN